MKFFFLLIGMAVSMICFAQSKKITRDLEKDLRQLLPAGPTIMDIRNKFEHTARYQFIEKKLKEGMAKNKKWWDENPQALKNMDTKLSYYPQMGITKEEYQEYVFNSKKVLNSAGSEAVIVNWSDSLISFKAAERLLLLDSTVIDFRNNRVLIKEHVLTPTDTFYFKSDRNFYQSAIRGYKWKFQSKSGTENWKPDATTNLIFFEFVIAVAEHTGETLVEITRNEVTNGVAGPHYKLPLFVK